MTFEEQEKRLRRLAGPHWSWHYSQNFGHLSLWWRIVRVDSWNGFLSSGESIAIGRRTDYSIGTKDPSLMAAGTFSRAFPTRLRDLELAGPR